MAKITKSKVTGLDRIVKNLNFEIKKVKNVSMKGLIEAATLIRRDMDKTPPIIPIDLGNLRASSFVVASNTMQTDGKFIGSNAAKFSTDHNAMLAKEKQVTSGKPLVAIGFSASYAEEVEADTITKRKRPGSGGAFFKSAIDRNKKSIIKVVQKYAKIK